MARTRTSAMGVRDVGVEAGQGRAEAPAEDCPAGGWAGERAASAIDNSGALCTLWPIKGRSPMVSRRIHMNETNAPGAGTREQPWLLKSPSGQSDIRAYRDETADPPALVV
jgi:hypothetical protein